MLIKRTIYIFCGINSWRDIVSKWYILYCLIYHFRDPKKGKQIPMPYVHWKRWKVSRILHKILSYRTIIRSFIFNFVIIWVLASYRERKSANLWVWKGTLKPQKHKTVPEKARNRKLSASATPTYQDWGERGQDQNKVSKPGGSWTQGPININSAIRQMRTTKPEVKIGHQ